MASEAVKGIVPLPVHGHNTFNIASGSFLSKPKENVIAIDSSGGRKDNQDPNSLLKVLRVRLVNSRAEEFSLVISPKPIERKKQRLKKELQRLSSTFNYKGAKGKRGTQVDL